MIKKIIFKTTRTTTRAAIAVALAAGPAVAAWSGVCTGYAQTTFVPIDDALPSQALVYRDGHSWVSVTRTKGSTDEHGLRRVQVHHGNHSYSARVGDIAILQLSADETPERLFRAQGLHMDRLLSRHLHIYAVRGRTGEDGVDIAVRLMDTPGVVSVVPDYYVIRRGTSINVPPDDPQLPAQWYLDYLDLEQAWQRSTGSADTTVVVVDNGCDMHHPDLDEAFLGGVDLVDGDDDPSYEPNLSGNVHGTACAGIIAARGDNGVGIAGVCPECTLRCVRLYTSAGADNPSVQLVPFSADVAAFDYAFEVGAAVVSNSWGFANPIPVPAPLRAAIESVHQDGRGGRGTVVVFAAGNESRALGDEELVGVDGVLNVGAVNQFDEAAPFGNFGASLDLSAPTGSFTTDISGPDGDDSGDYTSLFGGTSAACPVVAGIAALVLSADPSLTATEVDELLISTSRPAPFAEPDGQGHDLTYGYGIVDPVAALRELLGPPSPSQASAGAATGKNAQRAPTGGCGVSSRPQLGHTSGWLLLVLALSAWRLCRRVRP